MSTSSTASIPGIVKNGVAVLQPHSHLAEGTCVEILVEPANIPQQFIAEMKASDDAWVMIEELEAEEQ